MSSNMNITPEMMLAYVQDVGLEMRGNTPFVEFNGVKDLAVAGETDVSFCRFEGPGGKSLVSQSSAGLIFVPKSFGGWPKRRFRCCSSLATRSSRASWHS